MERKQIQINPSKSPWICLLLFFRIGAFQWVTANPNKKIGPRLNSRLRLRAKRLKRLFSSLLSGAGQGAGLIRRLGKTYTTASVSGKENVDS
jgi:hypothetical protein